MTNDGMILTADQIRFKFGSFRNFDAYLIGVSVDNLGSVQVHELPGAHQINHRPLVGKPATIDLGFSGGLLYSRTGPLPDVVAFSLVIVQDRGAARNAGKIIRAVNDDHGAEIAALQAAATANPIAGIVAAVLVPVVGIVGKVLENLQDRVIDTLQGAKAFSATDKKKEEFSDVVKGGNCDATFLFDLFNVQADEVTTFAIDRRARKMEAEGVRMAV